VIHDAHRKRHSVPNPYRTREVDEYFPADVAIIADLQIREPGFGVVNDHSPQDANPASDPGAFRTQDGDGIVPIGSLEKPQDILHPARRPDRREVGQRSRARQRPEFLQYSEDQRLHRISAIDRLESESPENEKHGDPRAGEHRRK